MRGAGATVLLLALLVAPHALAQVGSEPVSFLVYRPWPDPRAGTGGVDPLASALAPPPAEATRLPFTLVDRAREADAAPEGAPQSALAHYREISRLVQESEARGSPLALTLRGALAPGLLEVEAVPTEAARVQLVVFEHARAPYAARRVLDPIDVAAGEPARAQVPLDPSWVPERLGVVAIAQRAGETQSATWLATDAGPRTQTARSVLVEHVTASWCDACRPVDEAVALLAAQRGRAPAFAEGEADYLRAPGWPLLLGAALGLAAGVALARGRTRA